MKSIQKWSSPCPSKNSYLHHQPRRSWPACWARGCWTTSQETVLSCWSLSMIPLTWFWGDEHTRRYLDSSSGPCFCIQWCNVKTVHLVSGYWCTAATAWSSILWTHCRPHLSDVFNRQGHKGTGNRCIRTNIINARTSSGIINAKGFWDCTTSLALTGEANSWEYLKRYLKLDDDDQAIRCFKELGERCIPAELDSGELPAQVKALERIVCRVYNQKGATTLPSLRWELFRSKNLEGEMLPPTRATLLPHILRANYITMRDKSYQISCPDRPPIEANGWNAEKGLYIPVRYLALPAPQAVIELIKCFCKAGCKGRCSCSKNGLPCTPLCKCYGRDCANTIIIREDNRDSKLDDD